jgi:2-polyprenyl-6-hydroxyphenyl methylase/3-demethylubiquinone-9 3-methyltransferase
MPNHTPTGGEQPHCVTWFYVPALQSLAWIAGESSPVILMKPGRSVTSSQRGEGLASAPSRSSGERRKSRCRTPRIVALPESTTANSMSEPGPNADQRFVDYYAQQSASAQTRQRFEGTRRVTLASRRESGQATETLDVVDIGCGAGTQALMWAAAGHRVIGVDISAPLIELAAQRAAETQVAADFRVGSATSLPIADASVDIALVSELLEHLPEWQGCVNEAIRILRPGGVLYLSTTNRLCPVQQEFALPAYSWYPRALKKRCERLAVTTHGHWVGYTSFPAVHWFTYYQLRDYLRERGVIAKDRFDLIPSTASRLRAAVLRAIRWSPPLRFTAHVLTPNTVVVGLRAS